MPFPRLFVALGVLIAVTSPAAAFDCARASSEIEKAICASPVARETDDRMAAAYVALRAQMAPGEALTLRDSQRQWIKSRDNLCTGRTGPELSQCIIDETTKRWRFLAGLPEAGPGTGDARLKPVLITRQAKGKKTYAIDISAVAFADPRTGGERVFNDAVAALYADAPLNETVDFESAGELSYTESIDVTYASPDFISATGSGWRYDGGAHGNSWTKAVNVDLRNGRLLTFANLLPAASLPAFSHLCSDQLVAQKRAKMGGTEAEARRDLDGYKDAINQNVADLAHWSFRNGWAEVTFDPYAVGSYAEGDYTCRFDNGIIRLYADPAVNLPH